VRIALDRLPRTSVVMIAIALVALVPWGDASATTPRRILILHRPNTLIPSDEIVARIMRQTISSIALQSIDYDWESFDPPSLRKFNYDSAFADLLRKKYRDRKFEIVIAIQTPALDFVLKHRTELWPNAAVVFLGVPDDVIRQRYLGSRVTGIAGRIDFAGTLRLAFRLQPEAARVVVVGGVTQRE